MNKKTPAAKKTKLQKQMKSAVSNRRQRIAAEGKRLDLMLRPVPAKALIKIQYHTHENATDCISRLLTTEASKLVDP